MKGLICVDQKVYNEAVENIALIKEVIAKTKHSFGAFSKVFIYWGILFIPSSILTSLMMMNRLNIAELMGRYPALGFLSPTIIFAVFSALIYRHLAKKIPLVGLEKHLMKIWLLILAMNVIPNRIRVDIGEATVEQITVHVDTVPGLLFSLGIALIITSMFTGYKQPSYVAIGYIGIGLIHAYFNTNMLGGVIQVIYAIALPATFLYTGFYLRSQQARGE